MIVGTQSSRDREVWVAKAKPELPSYKPLRSAHYRAEIDGLRAIAVVSVVLFHYGFGIDGGYVGVDIFFVISGYLITGLITPRLIAGTFSPLEFYERRCRRILPALTVVLIISSIAAFILFLPKDLAIYSRSLAATSLFSSNFLFWRQAGYFDTASITKPLLHTWSLAVEEQFYILFPPALFIVYRVFRRTAHMLILFALAISLAFSTWAVTRHPHAAFYLAPSRAWELLLGAVISLELAPRVARYVARTALSLIGLVAITVSIFLFDPTTPFPGLAAVLPCLGTALVIHAEREELTCVGRALSWRPVTLVGLLSYSLVLMALAVIGFCTLHSAPTTIGL